MDEVKSGLSEAHDLLLTRWDMYAKPKDDGISAEVFDCDGEYRFTVRRHIDPVDLLALLRYGNHMLGVGRKIGEEHIKSSLRALVGAAAA